MFGAVYLLLHDKPIQSLAALIVALGSAFGPKIDIQASGARCRLRALRYQAIQPSPANASRPRLHWRLAQLSVARPAHAPGRRFLDPRLLSLSQ
jgi:hypothetical protein